MKSDALLLLLLNKSSKRQTVPSFCLKRVSIFTFHLSNFVYVLILTVLLCIVTPPPKKKRAALAQWESQSSLSWEVRGVIPGPAVHMPQWPWARHLTSNCLCWQCPVVCEWHCVN
ncbi:Hypothetical predicted protein [Xyrichtys novacula]|uniref:Uncharacterized protein n=1 Tax=Xyrichtys novacula TaxID=13765 RepID=A0AAV1H8F0_XYRNO|nr:Hypothetical predicted protein [Xyrichtys novacula]